MVVCPVCEKTWPKELDTCPDDGSWLHEETRVDLKPRVARTTSRPYASRAHDDTNPSELFAASKNPKDLPPGAKASEYLIEAKIGEGAMGAVYRARHPAIGKLVAIKVMSARLFQEETAVARFLAEARAVAAIRHPGIVDIFGYGRLPDGRTYLTMEWLDGENLAQRLARGPLPRAEALDVIRQIARALEAAHAKQIVHRDLKPENVFLLDIGDERVIKLCDFGLAKVGDKEPGVGVTREGQIIGTPMYMSPEQCRSKGVDHRTDVYALGCLSYLLLAGRVPFDQDNAAELISAHLMAAPPRARKFRPDLPAPLDDLLARMIAKEPASRPTLAEIRGAISTRPSRPWDQPEDLEHADTAHGTASTSDQTTPDSAPRGVSRWKPIALVLVLLAVAVLGALAFTSLF